MTATASIDRLGAYWLCVPCGDYRLGFVDYEDADEAADKHNSDRHRDENPDDGVDIWKEERA